MSKNLFTSSKISSKKPQYTKPTKFASGNFGEIFRSFDIEKNIEIAIKIESKHRNPYETLKNESHILKKLKGVTGVPDLLYFSSEDTYSILIMPFYGKSLKETLVSSLNFSAIEAIETISKVLDILEKVHEKKIVHRDLKPANILHDFNENSLILIDFGLSTFYKNELGMHIREKNSSQFVGNMRFGSLNAHFFKELSRKDDLESLLYMLIYFLKGELPWDGLDIADVKKKIKEIANIKQNLDFKQIFADFPSELVDFATNIKSLRFEQEPNYKHLRSLLQTSVTKLKLKPIPGENKAVRMVFSSPFEGIPQNSLEKAGKNNGKMIVSQGNQPASRKFFKEDGCLNEESSIVLLSDNYNSFKHWTFQNPFKGRISPANEELETNIVEDDTEFEFMCEKYEKLMAMKPKTN